MDDDGYPIGWPRTVTTKNGRVKLVLVPGGTFLMGSPGNEEGRYEDEGPLHEVTLEPFYAGRYPVTNKEYARLVASHDSLAPMFWSRGMAARRPVVGVSWSEARLFAEWVGGRLLSEAEWEHAARAGTTTRYWWGDELGEDRSNCSGSGSDWSGKQVSPVGAFAPNPFGLHDVHGNVWE